MMSNQIETKSAKELNELINDCRIRILEQLGIEVPSTLKGGDRHEGND